MQFLYNEKIIGFRLLRQIEQSGSSYKFLQILYPPNLNFINMFYKANPSFFQWSNHKNHFLKILQCRKRQHLLFARKNIVKKCLKNSLPNRMYNVICFHTCWSGKFAVEFPVFFNDSMYGFITKLFFLMRYHWQNFHRRLKIRSKDCPSLNIIWLCRSYLRACDTWEK